MSPAARPPAGNRAASPGAGHRVYVGLGSNLDGPESHLRRAVHDIHAVPDTRVCRCSSIYRSSPMGPPEQPDYLNAVVRLDSQLGPWTLLEQLQGIEAAHGRVRNSVQRWGPRTLDLDLLLYDDARIASSNLHIPHPGIHARSFVLIPLREIAPGLSIPGRGPVSALLTLLDDAQEVVAVGEPESAD